jgi:hypothetical protein
LDFAQSEFDEMRAVGCQVETHYGAGNRAPIGFIAFFETEDCYLHWTGDHLNPQVATPEQRPDTLIVESDIRGYFGSGAKMAVNPVDVYDGFASRGRHEFGEATVVAGAACEETSDQNDDGATQRRIKKGQFHIRAALRKRRNDKGGSQNCIPEGKLKTRNL